MINYKELGHGQENNFLFRPAPGARRTKQVQLGRLSQNAGDTL